MLTKLKLFLLTGGGIRLEYIYTLDLFDLLFIPSSSSIIKMWSTLTLLPLLASLVPSALAAPAAIPNGGVGVRPNDTAPVYAPMSDCEFDPYLFVHHR